MNAGSSKTPVSISSLAIPSVLLIVLLMLLGARIGISAGTFGSRDILYPQTVVIRPRTFGYRDTAEFYRDGYAVDAPLKTLRMTGKLEIMKYQVSVREYRRCVEDGACVPLDKPKTAPDVPATGVDYLDAQAYANWLSRKTGQLWILPSAEQLALAAGSRFPDDALGVDVNDRNPASRWLADYNRETVRTASRDPAAQPRGHFGENEFGVADFAGNIWEWTTTCSRRVNLSRGGGIVSDVSSCGIFMTIGRHVAPMSSFVREPKGGGCSVGVPPDNLGFRLARDTRWFAPLLRAFRKQTG